MGCQTEVDILKLCCRCGIEKPILNFYHDKNRKDGRYPACKECVAKDVRRYRAKPGTREKINETRRKLRARKPGRHWKEYGIELSAERYDEIYSLQGGCCAICGIHQSKLSMRLGVDHNHETGQVRGLVCIPCNTIIGIIEGKKEIVATVRAYLKSWQEQEV